MATDREPRDPHQPVDFVPVRIGAPRRVTDPLAIGAAVVALGLLVAIVKPWGEASTPGAPAAVTSPVPRASSVDVSSPVPSAFDVLSASDSSASAVAILAALQPRDAWGVRIVVAGSAGLGRGGTLIERWRERSRGEPDRSIRFQVDAPIVALGVTAPADAAALAIRVWKLQSNGTWRWLDARRPNSVRPAADLVLLPPREVDVPSVSWSSGRYRLDVLLGSTIERLEVSLDTPAWPGFDPDRVAVDRGDGVAWPGILVSGPFAIVDGSIQPLDGRPLPDPVEAASWLDVDGGVAVVSSRTVDGLGIALAPGSTQVTGTIRRLAPGALPGETEVIGGEVGVRLDAAARPVVAVRFDAPDGVALVSGVYALAVSWRAADLDRSATWVVEVRPASDVHATSLLYAARRYAAHAGSGTLVFSGGGRRRPDWAEAPVRTLPLGDAIGCGADIIDETPAVLGFAFADGETLDRIDARLVAPLGRTLDVRLRVAREVVPGLSLVAPARGAAFAAGIYRLAIDTSHGTRQVTLCLGTSPFSG